MAVIITGFMVIERHKFHLESSHRSCVNSSTLCLNAAGSAGFRKMTRQIGRVVYKQQVNKYKFVIYNV